jgi:UPF0755 protein
MLKLLRFVLFLAMMAGLCIAGAAAFAWWWLAQPLPLRAPAVELKVAAGATPRDIARGWVAAGVDTSPLLLYEWIRWSGEARKIRAGTYEIKQGATPRDLLAVMLRGGDQMVGVRFIEGWTFKQMRAELARIDGIKNESAGMNDAQIMQAIGAAGIAPEGRFFPDTYLFAKGASDLAVLKRAYETMQKRLDEAWAQRASDTPLKDAQQMLILASIVEKETGQPSDRGQIAGVFVNRLRVNMPLQTDPTVIYGLGDAFDGNLRRRDLESDTPYNTYTRRGLPPTPIAMPGAQSLKAAAQPEATKALYFVARGDGSSQFSESLAEHNRAVDKFQRGQGK